MSTNAGKMALVIALLLLAAGLKWARYGNAREIPLADAGVQISRVMSGEGWKRVAGPAHPLFDVLQFEKAGCENRIAIAVLGGNAESAELLRARAAGPILFLQGGVFSERPSDLRRQFARPLGMAKQALGLEAPLLLPALAFDPPPDPAASGCSGPSQIAWRERLETSR